MIKNYNIIRRY